MNDSDLKVQTHAVVAAITEDGGLIYYAVDTKVINTEVFVTFLLRLSERLSDEDFALFLDKLSVLESKDFEDLSITEIFNEPGCPQFNCIESFFRAWEGVGE